MASKVWLGLGVAALAGAAYYLTRPIEVDRSTGLSVAKPAPRPPAASQRPAQQQVPNVQKTNSSGLPMENGVLTTEAIIHVLQTMKVNFWNEMEILTKVFREHRRKVGHENLESYMRLIEEARKQHTLLFDRVFEQTIADFSLDQAAIRKYNEKNGPGVFYSHLEGLATNNDKEPQDLSMTAEQTALLIEDKYEMMKMLLGTEAITPEKLILNSYISEDLFFEKHGIEDEEVVAQSRRFKDHPKVIAAMAKLNSLIPK